MEFHEVANIFPLMSWHDYQTLKSDIAQNGLREPIVLHEGKIVDGRQRYRACLELGIEPKFREWDQQGSLVAFVVSLNLHRRHLTTSQRAMIAAEIKVLFEKEARKRQGARLDLKADLRERHKRNKGKASEQAARVVNVSSRSVESATKVVRHGSPELVEAVKKGNIAVSTAASIAALSQKNQKGIILNDDKREMREVLAKAKMLGTSENNKHTAKQHNDKKFVDDIMGLLAKSSEILGGRNPNFVATQFFQELTFRENEATNVLNEYIDGAKLICEIYRLWESQHLKVS